jgi:hypothetical protein
VPERLVALVDVDEHVFDADAHGSAEREHGAGCCLLGARDVLQEGKPTQQLQAVEMRTMSGARVTSLTRPVTYSRRYRVPPLTRMPRGSSFQ